MARSLRELLATRRDEDADLRRARYVRPEGGGQHLVELLTTNEQVLVGSLVGDWTFAPGALVVLGTYGGGRRRAILGLAPPGDQGASAFPRAEANEQLPERPRLLAAIPSAVLIGQPDQIVYLIGLGLSEDPVNTFRAVVGPVGAYGPDPYVTISEPQWVEDPAGLGLEVGAGMDVVEVSVTVEVTGPKGYEPEILAS
ncbi:MAG: hypothetical protein AAGM22_22690 [Acidobacteriota bacterium]